MLARLTAALACALAVAGAQGERAEPRPVEFWREIAHSGFAVPAGEEPRALLLELSRHFGSRDPELRDDLGYGICVQWIVRRPELLGADDLRALVERWTGNLRVGLGESGTDTVLLRSFSALALSLVAARDLAQPFLTEDETGALVGAALDHLAGERDLRGFVPEVGWHHAVAHAADLLKFLARSPKLPPAAQGAILSGIGARMTAEVDVVFVHGEHERLARAALSVVLREDFRAEALERLLRELERAGERARTGAPDPGEPDPGVPDPGEPDPARLAAARNAEALLESLYWLCAAAEAPEGVRTAILESLQRL